LNQLELNDFFANHEFIEKTISQLIKDFNRCGLEVDFELNALLPIKEELTNQIALRLIKLSGTELQQFIYTVDLQENKFLNVVNLSENEFFKREEDVEFFSAVLRSNQAISSLRLDSNFLGSSENDVKIFSLVGVLVQLTRDRGFVSCTSKLSIFRKTAESEMKNDGKKQGAPI
jgi:hypothetical protein